MAETAIRTKTKLGWAKSGMESSSDDEDAIIPGVNKTGPGNLRPRLRPRPRRDVRSKVAPRPPAEEDNTPSAATLSVQDLSQSLDERRLGPTGGDKRGQVSLKDLCVEDKRRIANLIRELAKVGEEREKAREDLEKERRSYELQILKLVEQQEQILRERQEVEKHLQECQQLLAQSQPLHPPPPATSLPPSPPPLTNPQAPPPPFPGPSYPSQWAWSESEGRGQELHQSLLGNVGSPDRRAVIACDGYPHTQALSMPPPPPHQSHPHHHPSQYPHPHPHHPAAGDLAPSHPHRHHHPPPLPHHHPAHPQNPHHHHPHHHHPHHHPSPHSRSSPRATHGHKPVMDFFANVMLQPEPLEILKGLPSPSHPYPNHHHHPPPPPPLPHLLPPPPPPPPSSPPAQKTSKEEVIERFFASQPQPPPSSSRLVSPKRREKSSKPPRPTSNPQRGFLQPVMSSTQKSAEIKDCLSVDSEFVPLVVDESSEKFEGGGGGRRKEEGEREGEGRVVFVERGKGEPRLHSPLGDAGDETRIAHDYRKLSQTQRKEHLLQQRANLLEEQQRLKYILTEQEAMLHEKQRALQARSHHRRHGNANDNAEEGGREVGGGERDDDPLGLVPQRLAIDAALERQRAIVDNLEKEAKHRSAPPATKPAPTTTTTTNTTTTTTSNTGGRKGRGEEEGGRRVEKGGERLSDIVRKLDYSLHSDTEDLAEGPGSDGASSTNDDGDDDNDEEVEEEDSPPSPPPPPPSAHRQEASTSISYRTIPRSGHGAKENVLDSEEEGGDDPHPPPAFPSPSLHTHTPGEKTMSVLEIINSLPSPGPTRDNNSAPAPRIQQFPPLHQQQRRDLSPLSGRWRKGGKEEDYEVEIVVMDSSEEGEEDVEEDEEEDESDVVDNGALEESQILDDIFFLK